MANAGKLGTANLAAATATVVYSGPAAGYAAAVEVAVCNRNSSSVKVRVSIGASTPAAQDYIEYDTVLPPNGVLERKRVVSNGENVVVYSDAANVSVRVDGYEEII